MIKLLEKLYCHNPREYWHSVRVSKLGFLLGASLNLDNEKKLAIMLSGLVHDIGKLEIENDILEKTSLLTIAEYKYIQNHSRYGYDLLEIELFNKKVTEAVLHHHERWDGLGYPIGLKNKFIPFTSRIIAIVDSFDAMVSSRPYKKSITIEEASVELKKLKEVYYDPNLVEAFIHFLVENRCKVDNILIIGKNEISVKG